MNQYQKLGFTDTGSHLEMQVIFIYLFIIFQPHYHFYHILPSFDQRMN